MKKARVIVTGSEGIVGSAVCAAMQECYEVQKLSLRFGHDFTDEEFVKNYFRENKAEYLVNCFGFNDHIDSDKPQETLFDVSLESIQKYLLVNVVALISVCREFAKNTESRGIVNISSIYGMVSPIPALYKNTEKHVGYSVSKAAGIQLTRHLATHLAPRVRANCVVLGGVDGDQNPEFKRDYAEYVPVKKMMQKDEIGGIIEYLCSDKSTYTTGAVIPVDGGWTAW
ncbi:MAG: SDR family oxidoreductase [Candidatus Omnitrophica bacterium]|nr:SDR family oxidoreductase [Candidatus Omnitrophota bacterium]